MNNFLHKLWSDEQGQDVAEYSVMLAVILVIVVGTIRLIGSNASNVFSNVGSSIQYTGSGCHKFQLETPSVLISCIYTLAICARIRIHFAGGVWRVLPVGTGHRPRSGRVATSH